MIRTALLSVAMLVLTSSTTFAQTVDKQKEAPRALLQMLHGQWKGGDCVGDYTFHSDGTYKLDHFTPVNHRLMGTWTLRCDSLPVTLILNCKRSDFRTKDPNGPEYEHLGKSQELKLVQLDHEVLAYQFPDSQQRQEFTRIPVKLTVQEQELAALQGTWMPLQYEEGGKLVPIDFHTKHIIEGDKVTVQVNGETLVEGKIVVDSTRNPKQLDFQFSAGRTDQFSSPRTDLMIYVRTGNYIIYCANRDGKTRPAEFATGTIAGGEYLLAWKIEK